MNDHETLEKVADLLDGCCPRGTCPGLAIATRLREIANDMLPYEQVDYLMVQSADMEARIAELEAALHRAQWALRQPADEWKSHCERRALDQIREVLPWPAPRNPRSR